MPRLTLESFNGEVIKYWDYIRRFKRQVDKVSPRFEDTMALLESSYAGKAQEVNAGIGCRFDSPTTYIKAWEQLDKKFGNAHGTFAWGTAHGFCYGDRRNHQIMVIVGVTKLWKSCIHSTSDSKERIYLITAQR